MGFLWLIAAFLIMLAIGYGLLKSAKLIQEPPREERGKYDVYACGEATYPAIKPKLTYRMYHYALIFSIVHIACLLLMFQPYVSFKTSLVFLGILAIAVALLISEVGS